MSSITVNKYTTDSSSSDSYFVVYLNYDTQERIYLKVYDIINDFVVSHLNSPHFCSNLPASPVYGVFFSQCIHYFLACSHYKNFTKTKQDSYKLIAAITILLLSMISLYPKLLWIYSSIFFFFKNLVTRVV